MSVNYLLIPTVDLTTSSYTGALTSSYFLEDITPSLGLDYIIFSYLEDIISLLLLGKSDVYYFANGLLFNGLG